MLNGNYELTVSPGNILVFSFVGFTSQEITVGNQSKIDVALEPSAIGVEEVVFIGYGTTKKQDATGSVAAVTAKDFNDGNITTPQQLLTGKIAGVVITDAGGAPGSNATIRIRGGSSMKASNDPLIVIDGFPIDNSSLGGYDKPPFDHQSQ